jgi:catechol-2,3-dioxygenase
MALSFDDCGDVVIRPKYLAHVVLKTSASETFKAMVNYYKIFLNATAAYENEYLSFLTYDEEHHRVAIAVFPGTIPKVENSSGMAHVAFAYNSLQDLALAYRQRKRHGILPFWSVNHGPTTSIYYKDPDGNEIETQVDNFESNEEVDKFMTGPAFASNPIGIDFDPEDLVKRLSRGEADSSIKKRVEIGSRSLPT